MRLYRVDLESDTFTDKSYSENVPGYINITWQSKTYPGIVRVRFFRVSFSDKPYEKRTCTGFTFPSDNSGIRIGVLSVKAYGNI